MPTAAGPERVRGAPARAYALAVGAVLAATLVCQAMLALGISDHANLIMVYLAGVALVAVGGGRGPAAVAAGLGVAAFDFFFVPPHLTFAVSDTQYLVTFAVMLAVGLLISTLSVRVRAQTEAAERSRVEAETERLRHTLLASVSHDLRTPLAAITAATTTLLGNAELDAAARRDLLETTGEESQRLSRLVTSLLDMTRMESGPLPLQREWLPIEEVVGSALRLLEGRLAAATVETHLPDGLPLVAVDALLIEQVLVNLVENALRYAGAAVRLHIGATADGDAVHIEVADDGPGLPVGEEERIFEKFYRGASRERGFGLGLAICRAIVSAHGGRIRAQNRSPHGASFHITLPLGGAAPAPLPGEPAEPGGEGGV